MWKLLSAVFFLLYFLPKVFSQDEISWEDDEDEMEEISIASFYDTRAVNGHSTEVLGAGILDFRISHKFGDIATSGSYHRFFGLDNSSDIRIALEYGVFKNFNIGFGRSKGAGPYLEIFDGYAKYKILQQGSKMPISMTFTSTAYLTGMKGDTASTSIINFQKFGHRFSYHSQLIVSRNFSDWVSVQLSPGFSWRNLVYYNDQNIMFTMGTALKVRITKKIALLSEYSRAFRNHYYIQGIKFVDAIGFGIEFKTYAHVFQINFTNSRGFGEGQFIPYTKSRFRDGEFRLGFKISRHFKLK